MRLNCFKLIALIAIIVIAVSLLFGCQKAIVTESVAETDTVTITEATGETAAAITTTTEEAKPVTLTIWWWGEQDVPGLENWLKETGTKFSEKHPNVKIEFVLQGDDTQAAFKAAASAKSGPDIACEWFGMYMFEDVWLGNAAPISDYINAEELSHWLEKSQLTWDSKVWGVNLYAGGALSMAYNKEIFKQAGLDINKLPVTWNDWNDALTQLKNAGFIPIGTGYSDGWMGVMGTTWFTNQLVTGTEIKKAVLGEISFEDPRFADIWKRLDEWNKKGFFNDNISSIDFYSAHQEFSRGKYAITFTTDSNIIAYNLENNNIFSSINPPLISDKPWVMPATTTNLFITNWSPNKELAAEFLASFHEMDRMQSQLDMFKGQILPSDDRFDYSQITDPYLKNMAQGYLDGLKNNVVYFEYYIPYAIAEAYVKEAQLYFGGTEKPEDCAKVVQKAAEEWRKLNPQVVEAYKKW